MTLGELIEKLGGRLVQGDAEWPVDGVNSHEHAKSLEVAFADSQAAIAAALANDAGIVVLPPGAASEFPHGKCIVEADQPRLWFAKAAKLLDPAEVSAGLHPSAVISPHVELGANVSVGACAVIEHGAAIGAGTHVGAGVVIGVDVRVGESCRIYPRVVIYSGTTLGDRVVVHAGAVLGAVATGAVGMITDAAQAEHILLTGQADMVFVARAFLRDPYWPLHAAQHLHDSAPWPPQYLRAAPAGTSQRKPIELTEENE